MIHELLIALYGHETQLIKNAKNSKHGNEISSNFASQFGFSTLHKSELIAVNKILNIASIHCQIVKFCAAPEKFDDESFLTSGLYMKCLKNAIFEETKPYRLLICELEAKYLANKLNGLYSICSQIEIFLDIFTHIQNIIDTITQTNLHGCQIFNFIHKDNLITVGEAGGVVSRLESALRSVFFNHLTHWTMYGDVVDNNKEFFITKSNQDEEAMPSFSIDTRMLPEFIPIGIAEKILFIGESILQFQHKNESKEICLLNEGISPLYSFSHELTKEFTLISKLHSLALNNSDWIQQFFYLIEEERATVARKLYTVVMKSGFIDELELMRNSFLLGFGNLFDNFCSILNESEIVSEPGLIRSFQKACSDSAENEAVLERIKISSKKKNSNKFDSKDVRLNIEMCWPLSLIFNNSVQDDYNQVFTTLFKLTQTQVKLQSLWAVQKGLKDERFNLKCWILRHNMTLLIHNILYYIQVDILESEFCDLKKRFLGGVEDYEKLVLEHHLFLNLISNQCFVSHPLIASILTQLLSIVNQFCHIFTDLSSEPKFKSQFSRQGSTKIDKKSCNLDENIEIIKEDFDRVSRRLFSTLWSLCRRKNAQHTSQLVMRIDFNKFYSCQFAEDSFIHLDE